MNPVETLMNRCLQTFHFDFALPDPHLAWLAFNKFIAEPIPGTTTATIGFECFNIADRDDILYLAFIRSIEEPSGIGYRCGCLLSRPVPDQLKGWTHENWWWPEHSTLAAWRNEVESTPVFKQCLALNHWKWEGFSD